MKRIPAWETADGCVFTSEREAKSHADKRYGARLSALAHEALRCDKYVTMTQFLDDNVDKLAELKALKADITLDKESEE